MVIIDRYLFRGKNLDSKWLLGQLYEYEHGKFYIIPKEATEQERCNIIKNNSLKHWIEPATKGQCTGLKDKNGASVFEGDIVEVELYNGLYDWTEEQTIIFKNGCFGFNMTCEDSGHIYFCELWKYTKILEFEYISNFGEVGTKFEPLYTIIGNIHN